MEFDSSIDVAIKLGVDPKKSNEMVRGVVNLPHGTGKKIRVLALVPADKENDAREAGADMVGLDEYLQKIKDDIEEDLKDQDVIIYTSGLGGLFKPGIPIGKISKDTNNKVEFFSDFTQLDYVKITSYTLGDKK